MEYREHAILKEGEPTPHGARTWKDTGRRRWYVEGTRVKLAAFVEAVNKDPGIQASTLRVAQGSNQYGYPCAIWQEVKDG